MEPVQAQARAPRLEHRDGRHPPAEESRKHRWSERRAAQSDGGCADGESVCVRHDPPARIHQRRVAEPDHARRPPRLLFAFWHADIIQDTHCGIMQ